MGQEWGGAARHAVECSQHHALLSCLPGQVRYSVLLLDLGADDLVTELFSTVFGAIT